MPAVLTRLATCVAARPQRLLWALGAWHLLFWVLAPTLGYAMLPLDTLELLGWGQEWQLGYYKHPPLGAWLGEAFLQLAGGSLSSLYLLAQLCVLITLGYVYACGRLFLDPLRAALATALLEGSYFHTFLTPNFNMNSLQLPVWAGLSYHFLCALRIGSAAHWLGFGAFAALALLSKYSGLLLLGCCGLALLASAQGRQRLHHTAPWLGAALALLLLAPHLTWLAQHWQLPWNYLRSFDQGGGDWTLHLHEPLRFGLGALAGLLLSGVLWLSLWRRGQPAPAAHADTWLLALLVFGPLLLSILYGLISGSRLKSTWAFPFFSLIGVLWLGRIPAELARERLPRFFGVLISVVLLSCALHVGYKTRWGDSKTRFDAAALAEVAQSYWSRHQNGPLQIVVGNHIDSAILSGYLPDRPSMLVDGDFRLSPWLHQDDLARHGGLWICRLSRPCPALQDDAVALEERLIDGQHFRLGLLAPEPTP
jgi:4-amino-4-deoxy-L-arabinose transferase-like glycosyltransferase